MIDPFTQLSISAQWAGHYAGLGWHVFSLHSIEAGRCSCGSAECASPGKHPRTPHGLHDATTNLATIAAWWRQWPAANVGVRTGQVSGIVVVDIDPRHGGDASLAKLKAEQGELPPTCVAATGGGGRHSIFKRPKGSIRNRANVMPGIDVRGDGGYIVVCPSNHASGSRYAWAEGLGPQDLKLVDIPDWLLDIIRRPSTDLATARRILSRHIEGVALRESGVIDARADRFAVENQKPLAEHVRDYLRHCENVGIAPQSIKEKARHLDRVLEGTKATRLSELSADAVERHMRAIVDGGLSARTANFDRQDVVAFLSWCERTGRVESNQLKVVKRLDERRDRRRVRRPLTDDELGRLLDVAESHGRKAWYLTAVLAGLRRGDLKRLTWADVDFAEGSITITDGKAKREDVIPLHAQLANELRRRLDANPALPTAKVFPQAVQPRTVLFDLLRAGLAREEPLLDVDGKPILVGKRHPRPKDAYRDGRR